MNDLDPLIRKVIEAKAVYKNLSVEHWLKYELFSWVWWVNLLFVVIPLLYWLKVVDKKRILEITVFGLIINVMATFLDIVGSEFLLWEYPIRMLPHAPMLFPSDYVFLPVVFMLIYQYFPNWRHFLIGITLMSAVLAFVLEPIAVLINEYLLIRWKFVYSFPIYIICAIIGRLITEWFARRSVHK